MEKKTTMEKFLEMAMIKNGTRILDVCVEVTDFFLEKELNDPDALTVLAILYCKMSMECGIPEEKISENIKTSIKLVKQME